MTATAELPPTPVAARPDDVRVRSSSVWILVGIWLVLHLGCMFTPGLLDDVDSIYIEAAREMLVRHDYVTPYVDGVRFFDKPPLMYWMAAGSMKVFGPYDWAARLPLSLCVLALFLCVYALGKRLYGERGGFYAALAIATSLGPYLFTRFYIPDILNALWMTLGSSPVSDRVGPSAIRQQDPCADAMLRRGDGVEPFDQGVDRHCFSPGLCGAVCATHRADSFVFGACIW